MAKRKPKPEPHEPRDATTPDANDSPPDAGSHGTVAATDPFEFPFGAAAEPAPRTEGSPRSEPAAAPARPPHASADVLGGAVFPASALPPPPPLGESERRSDAGGERKTWAPVVGWRGDYEVGVKLLEDRRFRQVQLQFAEKPSDAVRQAVRDAGFQWRSQEQAWTKQIDPDTGWRTRAEAEALFERVTAMLRVERGLGPARDTTPWPG